MRSLIFLLLFSSQTFAALSIRDLDDDWSNGHEGAYDDVLDITWLADANLPLSNMFGLGLAELYGGNYLKWDWNTGGLTGLSAKIYLASVNTQNYLGHSNWRLPQNNNAGLPAGGQFEGGNGGKWNISAPIDEYNPTGASPGFTGYELSYHYYNNFKAHAPVSGEYIDGNAENTYGNDIFGIWNAENQDNLALFDNINSVPGNIDVSDFLTGIFYDQYYSYGFDFEGGTHYGIPGARPKQVWLVHDGDIGASPVPLPAGIWLFTLGLISLRLFKR